MLMEYYIVKCNKAYDSIPVPTNWHNKLDIRNICKDKSNNIKPQILLKVIESKNHVWVDFLDFPFPLVSNLIKETMNMYNKTIFKQIILLDQKYEETKTYNIPVLEIVLVEIKQKTAKKGFIAEIKSTETRETLETTFFYVKNQFNQLYLVAKIDFLESILRRGARGIEIVPIEFRREE